MTKAITPEAHIVHWKRFWASPRKLTEAETDEAFEAFIEEFVPGHMKKKFRQFFPTPRAKFGNRFFHDDAVYYTMERTLASLGISEVSHAEVTVIHASPDALEGYRLRGEVRRALRDIVVDDWHAACAIAEGPGIKLYIFVEPKMRGCIVYRVMEGDSADSPVV